MDSVIEPRLSSDVEKQTARFTFRVNKYLNISKYFGSVQMIHTKDYFVVITLTNVSYLICILVSFSYRVLLVIILHFFSFSTNRHTMVYVLCKKQIADDAIEQSKQLSTNLQWFVLSFNIHVIKKNVVVRM